MEQVLQFILGVLDIVDQHEGAIAMLGIAITVIIFRKEVTNNYYTLERDNFNEIFKDIILNQIPNRISLLESAPEREWRDRFEELIFDLEKMLKEAKYFKYAMPYFFRYIEELKMEIGDLPRHENWRLYRTSESQTKLVEKKCRRIIKAVNDASKGRVFAIKWYQWKFVKELSYWFKRKIVDRPIDNIIEQRHKEDFADYIEIFNDNNELVNLDELKKYLENQ